VSLVLDLLCRILWMDFLCFSVLPCLLLSLLFSLLSCFLDSEFSSTVLLCPAALCSAPWHSYLPYLPYLPYRRPAKDSHPEVSQTVDLPLKKQAEARNKRAEPWH
jgi:hypothetical protein